MAVIIRAKDEADAVRLDNAAGYGLSSAISPATWHAV
ncbi:hypothetical protein [Sphingomonas sp. 22176]